MSRIVNVNSIYELVGRVVELVQMLEWNIALLIGINPQENHFTAGELKHMCDKLAKISQADSIQFSKILRGRNYLIHNFFKYEEIENFDQAMLELRYKKMQNFFLKTNEFNNRIVALIKSN